MKKYLAELIGTFALVFLGCSAAVINSKTLSAGDVPFGIGMLGIALAFGLTVLVMCYAIGPISGCHINPAITIAMLVARKISGKDAFGYIVAQFIGATIGAAVLYLLRTGSPDFTSVGEWGLGSNGWGPGYLGGYNTTSAFLAETVLTFLFLFVIFAATSRFGNSTMAGLAIGLTLVIIHLAAIPISGASVNPARSFGPAILAGGKALSQLWLFLVAPVIGGILAALLWRGVFEKE